MVLKKKCITPMMMKFIGVFCLRLLIFLLVLYMYIFDRKRIHLLMTQDMIGGVTLINVLWLIFMIMMIRHIFPSKKQSMAMLKSMQQQYLEVREYSQLELYKYVQLQNIKAWQVMLCWLIFNSIFGVLYLFKIIGNEELLVLTVFYYLCDYICILFYCPFKSLIMKNRCCVNCRIYDWGHFMMFTPMLFIRNFFSWSLFFTSCIVLIRWEIIYARHPERFWDGSNDVLKCKNCKDKLCRYKKNRA